MKAEASCQTEACGEQISRNTFHADRNALGLLGLARRAGKLGSGEAGTRKAVRGGEAKLILLASDASRNAFKRADGFARSAGIPLLRLDADQAVLSTAAGASGGVIFAVCDEGLSAAFLKKLKDDPANQPKDMI